MKLFGVGTDIIRVKRLKKSLKKKICFRSSDQFEDPFSCVLRFLQSINTRS